MLGLALPHKPSRKALPTRLVLHALELCSFKSLIGVQFDSYCQSLSLISGPWGINAFNCSVPLCDRIICKTFINAKSDPLRSLIKRVSLERID